MIGFWIIENWIFDKGPDEEVKNGEEDEEDSYNDDDDEDLDTESYEYDDYMDDIPGSYFTMDPSAYTLTWSAQPKWAKGPSHNMGSMNSVENNETHA